MWRRPSNVSNEDCRVQYWVVHANSNPPEIVRRVVEARRQHEANQYGGSANPAHSAARTQPLTPLNEKDDPLNSDPPKESGFKKFLRKLGCFR